MLESLFCLALLGSAFSYFIYPLTLLVLPKRRQDKEAAEIRPLTLIITAYNEEKTIGEKIDNSLSLDYPRDKLEIIVASDCSEDDTDTIVQGYTDRQVRLVRADQRLGKEYAQSMAVAEASGEILVFSDAATRIPEDALLALNAEFDDAEVGAVSSEDRFISEDGQLVGEGLYVKYEMWLRNQESKVNSVVGLSGSFFAARKEVCEDWDIKAPSDFNTALNCAKLGFKAISSPNVFGYYKDIKDPAKEYQRKIRTVIRGLTGLMRHSEVMNPLKYGLFAYQVISHKLLRWLVPWFMLLALFCNIFLAGESFFYRLLLLAQVLFYLTIIVAQNVESARTIGPVRILYFFAQVNIAIAQATLMYLSGKRMTVWTPSKR